MYRSNDFYKSIAIKAISIYVDYGINNFPLDPVLLCGKMGIKVIRYSDFPGIQKELLGCSFDGFCVKSPDGNNTIYYNDRNINSSRIDYTILHELWHIVYGDSEGNETDEEKADFFAKYMKCPIPYLIIKDIRKKEDIKKIFGVSQAVAKHVEDNVTNRLETYGDIIYDYELPLLYAILGDQLKNYDMEIVKSPEVMSYDSITGV